MDILIQKLIQLVQENPELEIKTMVDTEIFSGDEYPYREGSFTKVEKTEYWVKDERVFIGKYEIEEEIENLIDEDSEISNESLEISIENKYKELKENNDIKDVIVVYVGN